MVKRCRSRNKVNSGTKQEPKEKRERSERIDGQRVRSELSTN